MPGYRADAAYDTAFLARELTQIETELYKVKYQDILWRQFVPVKNAGLNPGAKYFVYKVFNYFGLAKYISDFAADLPSVGIGVKEVVNKVHSMGASYQYSADDLMNASMANLPLERLEAEIAFEVIERLMDHDAAFGNPNLGMVGFLQLPGVAVDTAAVAGSDSPTGATTSTYFTDKTPDKVLTDLHHLSQAMVDGSKQLLKPNTMIMPPTLYGYIATKSISTNQPQMTILDVFLKNSPYIKSVGVWIHLETAGATAGPRIMVCDNSSRNGEAYVPMEAKAMPAQERNLSLVINVWAKFGGFILRQPLAYRYLDLCGPVV
jgi:hypothetical protein